MQIQLDAIGAAYVGELQEHIKMLSDRCAGKTAEAAAYKHELDTLKAQVLASAKAAAETGDKGSPENPAPAGPVDAMTAAGWTQPASAADPA